MRLTKAEERLTRAMSKFFRSLDEHYGGIPNLALQYIAADRICDECKFLREKVDDAAEKL